MAVVASLSSTFAELRTLFVAHQPAAYSALNRCGMEMELEMRQRRAVT
jgi:hypothetical protein